MPEEEIKYLKKTISELSSDMKEIKGLLSGDDYSDGFVRSTKGRLFRLEVSMIVVLAFMVGVVIGDLEGLIQMLLK